jgi:hypothetical protein
MVLLEIVFEILKDFCCFAFSEDCRSQLLLLRDLSIFHDFSSAWMYLTFAEGFSTTLKP